jgi:hypothetical protein
MQSTPYAPKSFRSRSLGCSGTSTESFDMGGHGVGIIQDLTESLPDVRVRGAALGFDEIPLVAVADVCVGDTGNRPDTYILSVRGERCGVGLDEQSLPGSRAEHAHKYRFCRGACKDSISGVQSSNRVADACNVIAAIGRGAA